MATAAIAVAAFITANAAVIAIAVSLAAVGFAYYAAKKAKRGQGQNQAERKQILRSGAAPKTLLYGQTISSGVLIFAEEQPGEQEDGEFLTLVLSVAGTEIEDIGEIYFNEETKEGTGGVFVSRYPQGRTTPDPGLLNIAPSWQPDMVGKGFAWIIVYLKFDQEKFPTGVPNITMRKFGRRVYDPRTGATAYSDNPALCLLDYLKNHPSLQYEDDELLMDTFTQSANYCDEAVAVYDNSGQYVKTEKRYVVTAEIDYDENPSDVIDRFLAACCGEPIRVAGRFGVHVGVYYGPAFITLTQDDVTDSVVFQPEVGLSEAFNVVKGTFNSAGNNYAETDYPEVRFQDWVNEDGTEIIENLNLEYVSSSSQAQRVADITARRSRYGMIVEIPCNYRGMNYPPGTSLKLRIEQMNLIDIEFKVLAWRHSADEGVILVCRRESSDFYDQREGRDVELPPIVNLPDSGVVAPTNIQINATQVGEVVQGQLTWKTTNFRIAFTDVLLYRVSEAGSETLTLSASVPFPGALLDLSGQLVGTYKAVLTSVGVNGARSTSASYTFTLSAPEQPDSVAVERSNWNIELVPNYDSGIIPVNTLFEFYFLADPASYSLDPPTYGEDDRENENTKFVQRGSSLNQGGLFPDRYCHYWIRAINAYGASDYIYVRTGTTRESDLVTTVVERLVAVEIVSANWSEEQKTGYKLFSPISDPYTLPNGQVLEDTDGLLVANKAVIRGDSYFEGTLSIEDETTARGLKLNNQKLTVYDENGRTRVEIGKLV